MRVDGDTAKWHPAIVGDQCRLASKRSGKWLGHALGLSDEGYEWNHEPCDGTGEWK